MSPGGPASRGRWSRSSCATARNVSAERRARVLAAADELGYSPNAMARGPRQPAVRDGRRAAQRPAQPVLRRDVRRLWLPPRGEGLPAAARCRQRPAAHRAGGDARVPRVPPRRRHPRQPAPAGRRHRRAGRVGAGRRRRPQRAGRGRRQRDDRRGRRGPAGRRPPGRARSPPHRAHRRRPRRRRGPAAAGLPPGDGAGRAGTRTSRCSPATSPSGPAPSPAPPSPAQAACPTAIFAANDLVAVGAIDALERRGPACPATCRSSATTTPSSPASRHISLTTVDQPREEMGRIAVGLLADRMDGGRGAPELVLTTPTLVVRDTTAAPRA